MDAADLAESTVLGPSSPTAGIGFKGRILLAVSVFSEPRPSLVSAEVSALKTLDEELIPSLCGERRNSGLEAYGSAVSQVTRGSKKLDSSFGVVNESKAAVVGVLVGV
jgi:hypothetical protein